MDIVKKWFDSGCDYATGVAIYSQLPKHNPTLLKTFQRKNNSFNAEKLKYELNKFNEKYSQTTFVLEIKKSVTEVVQKPQNSISEKEQKNAVLFHQLPETLRPVLLEANQLFKENCLLKVNLNELPEHAEKKALEIQTKIHSNIKKNELCWAKIDLFIEKRIVSESPKSEFEGLTHAKLWGRRELLYASRSKLESRLNKNREVLKTEDSVKVRAKIEREIAKQEKNLLIQNEKLIIISNLIDGN